MHSWTYTGLAQACYVLTHQVILKTRLSTRRQWWKQIWLALFLSSLMQLECAGPSRRLLCFSTADMERWDWVLVSIAGFDIYTDLKAPPQYCDEILRWSICSSTCAMRQSLRKRRSPRLWVLTKVNCWTSAQYPITILGRSFQVILQWILSNPRSAIKNRM